MQKQKGLSLCLLAVSLAWILSNALSADAATTTYPWLSFRHDLWNSGAASDSGYPTEPTLVWVKNRRPNLYDFGPSGCRGPVVVSDGMVFTTGSSIVQANDVDTGELIWYRSLPWELHTTEPPDAPPDWCYNDTISPAFTNTGNCYAPPGQPCPNWCFRCTDVLPDCSASSLVNPLQLGAGYKQFITGATLDPSYGANGCMVFGTFDGRVISLDMATGATLWERTPFKDPGGPNEGKPWYNQKFAWHLSPPALYNGRVYIGSFFPSFYSIFDAWAITSAPDYDWPSLLTDATHYWVGRDGFFYALDESSGDIDWTWDPRGCGVTNLPPITNGKVFINADTATDYHYGQFAAVNAETGVEEWRVGTIPMAQGGSMPIYLDTVYFPGGDGALWALSVNGIPNPHPEDDKNISQVKWTYWAGYNNRGSTGMENSPALDAARSWIIGASDTGRLFVINKDTGRVVKEAFLGVPSWNVGDPHPASGYWFPGAAGICIVPADGLLYVSGTDFERAWRSSNTYGREKLFCFDYVSDPDTLIPLWEYQFCKDDDCSQEENEYVVRGQPPLAVSWYSVATPALSDGSVFYASYNGKIYKFGESDCGNGSADPGEQCGEPGLPACADGSTCAACRCESLASVCGDGTPEFGEQCGEPGLPACAGGSTCNNCICESQTLITLSSFDAQAGHKSVTLSWSTESEVENTGFNLYRSETRTGRYELINPALIPARGSPARGARYEYVDSGLKNKKTYWFMLEDIDLAGVSAMHGPLSATPRFIKALFGSRHP